MALLKLKKKEEAVEIKEEVKQEEVKQEGGRYKVIQVPKEFSLQVYDEETKTSIGTDELLVTILLNQVELSNKIDEIYKAIASS